jgi:hypothetical protein
MTVDIGTPPRSELEDAIVGTIVAGMVTVRLCSKVVGKLLTLDEAEADPAHADGLLDLPRNSRVAGT